MKRLMSLTLAILLALAAVQAVGAQAETTLTFVRIGNDEPEKLFWLDVIAQFEAENPGIRVQYDDAGIGGAMDTKLNTLFDANIGPDIIGHGILSVASRVEQGHYQAIDGLFNTWEGKDDLMPSVLANGTYKGQVYGLGYSVTPYIFAYRIDLFEQAGITRAPETWEELARDARLLTIRDEKGDITQSGFCFPQSGGNMVEFDVFVYGNGGAFMDADGNPTLGTPEQVEAMDFLKGLLKDVNIPYDNNTNNPFLRGNAAMTLINNAELRSLLGKPEYAGKIGVAMPPRNKTMATFSGCNMLFIGRDCKNPEAAFRFISFVLSPEIMMKRARDLNVPVTRSSLLKQFVALDPYNAVRYDCVLHGTGMPRTLWSSTFQRLRNEAVQNALYGGMDAQAALQAAQEELLAEMVR